MQRNFLLNGLTTDFKRYFSVLLAIVLSMTMTPLSIINASAKTTGKKVKIVINQKQLKTSAKLAPRKIGKVVVAPAKQLAKGMGGSYKYNKSKKTITIKRKKKTVTLKVNSKKAKLGKKSFKLRKPIKLTAGMPMIDAVVVAKKLGFKYSKYKASEKTLYIASSKAKLSEDKGETPDEGQNDATPTSKPSYTEKHPIDPNAGADTYRKTGLPVVFITTDNGRKPEHKDVYQPATICIEQTGAGGVKLLEETEMTIAIRGNSTSNAEKKPYKFKFTDNSDGTSNKKEVLGMSAHHKWNLLANAYDKSLLRNAVALKFASMLDGLDFTPDFRFVDVVLNGDYIGNYMLTEQVEIANNRVDIDKKNDAENKFGYIVEWDQRAAQDWMEYTEGLQYFRADVAGQGSVPFAYKDPDYDDMTAEVRKYIANDVRKIWEKIGQASDSNTEFLDYIDLDSFIDFYMVQELMMPIDGYNFSSIYMYKDSTEGAKMHMGPAWDYDLAIGNTNPGDISNIYYRSAGYCAPLTNNSETKQKYIDRWKKVKTFAEEMLTYIDTTAAEIKKSAELNYQRWPINSVDIYDNTKIFKSFDDAVASMKSLYQTRYNAMNKKFSSSW